MAARILVADDSVTIQKVVELTFSKEDFVLIPARNGEEAIRKAKEVRPDLILVDLVMPDKTGYEVCTALRAEPMLRAVPIIMLTGTFEAFDKDQGLRAGANDFLTKPFESQVLIGKVKQLLFAKTVDLGAPASPAPAAKMAPSPPPMEAPRGTPTAAPPVPSVVPPARPITPPAPPAAPVPPPPAKPAAPTPAPPLAGEPPTLELPALELEAIPGGPKPAGAEASLHPEGLSLEELLAPAPDAPPEPPAPPPPPGLTAEPEPEMALGPIPLEGLLAEDEPVFDLTADMQGPSLPLVEVGTGEPPALSVEDLLGPAKADSGQAAAVSPTEAAPEVAPLEGLVSMDEPVFDLTADMQGPSLPLVEVGTGEPPALSVEDLLRPAGTAPIEAEMERAPEVRLEPISEGKPEAVPSPEIPLAFEPVVESPPEQPRMAAPFAGPADIGELVEPAAADPSAEAVSLGAEVPQAPASPETWGIPPVPPKAAAAPVAAPPPVVPATEAASPAAALAPEMGTLRQAVTERVAHELAKDLSDQLIERIERIVWEVVPDLAEILINREIERLRAMAEDKLPS